MRVVAPNKEYSGRVGRDIFVNGVCENASPEQEMYYRRHGYTIKHYVEPLAIPVDLQPAVPPLAELPGGNASREDWAAAAAARGIEVTEEMKRDDIRELVTQHEADTAADQ